MAYVSGLQFRVKGICQAGTGLKYGNDRLKYGNDSTKPLMSSTACYSFNTFHWKMLCFQHKCNFYLAFSQIYRPQDFYENGELVWE